MRLFKYFIRGMLLLLASLTLPLLHADSPIEGKDYTTLSTPATSSPEIIEFFSYTCSFCRALEPYVETWRSSLPKGTVFRRVHVAWDKELAKLFFTLERLGVVDRYQLLLFKALQDRPVNKNDKDLHRWVETKDKQALYRWIAAKGMNRAKFEALYSLFSVDLDVKNADQLSKHYAISGVPLFVLNGKYSVVLQSVKAQGKEEGKDMMFKRILNVMDYLLKLKAVKNALPKSEKDLPKQQEVLKKK